MAEKNRESAQKHPAASPAISQRSRERHCVTMDFSTNPPFMRFHQDKRSFGYHSIGGFTNRPDNQSLFTIADRSDDLRARSGAWPRRQGDRKGIIQETEFIEHAEGPFFKYVSDDALRWMKQGSFQFGTAAYYRQIENPLARDAREGHGVILFESDGEVVVADLTAGLNAALLCGTSSKMRDDTDFMPGRFGDRLVKLEPLPEFVSMIKELSGAVRVRVIDIMYVDLAVVVRRVSCMPEMMAALTVGPNGGVDPNVLNSRFFDTLYDSSILPSILIKLTSYSEECERRIVVEMPEDIAGFNVTVSDPGLARFVQEIGK